MVSGFFFLSEKLSLAIRLIFFFSNFREIQEILSIFKSIIDSKEKVASINLLGGRGS